MAHNTVARFDPFGGLEALRRDLFDDGILHALRGEKLPTTDVYTDDDKDFVVEAHLPHFDPDDVTVNVDKGALVIQAERHEKDEDKGKKYMLRESSASLYRRIQLPDNADAGEISAAFHDGVLTVTVPLTATSTPQQIPITSAA